MKKEITIKKLLLILLLIFFYSFNLEASHHNGSCYQVTSALLANNKNQALSPTVAHSIRQQLRTHFKKTYSEELQLTVGSNRHFIKLMKEDFVQTDPHIVYFDVENSVQKKLNDDVYAEKTMVDAINNSFMAKLNKNLRATPLLVSRLTAEYKDYKSYRLRFKLKAEDDVVQFEELLNNFYQKTNREFSKDFYYNHMDQTFDQNQEIPQDIPRAEKWFLAGSGNNSLEANMSARGARSISATKEAIMFLFKNHINEMAKDIEKIEFLRIKIAQNESFLKNGLTIKTDAGKIIPSKPLIAILKKYKPRNFSTIEEFHTKLKFKIEKSFGTQDLNESDIDNFMKYFLKVDTLSPPIFIEDRIQQDLSRTKFGVVSVDFAGVGVENLFHQMEGLSMVNYQQPRKKEMVSEALNKVQKAIDQVTAAINQTKIDFQKAILATEENSAQALHFSGDDGLLVLNGHSWEYDQKLKLLTYISALLNPAKFRITFVPSSYLEGQIIASTDLSLNIVKAELFEKKVREEAVGVNGISFNRSEEILISVDFNPSLSGGIFNLIVLGKGITTKEKRHLQQAVKKNIKPERGEKLGSVVYLDTDQL